jgi:hypothetical protein
VDLKPIPECDQAAFFAGVLEQAKKAEARNGFISVNLEIAECPIELRFANPLLCDELLPALRHNIIPAGARPKAVVHIWDTRSSGFAIPRPPCPKQHFTDRGDIWGFNCKRYRAAFHFVECSLNIMDLECGEAVYWVQHADNLPYWAKASPLRTILHWIVERDGGQLLHAAAVGTERGAVLITGKGGVGKSTTALTALDHGLGYVADDYLAVRIEPTPRVFSLYCTAKLNAEDVVKFPRLAPHVVYMPSSDGEKAVIQLDPALKDQLSCVMDIKAILTPEVVRQSHTDFAPVDAMTLRRSAAFTTLSQLPYAGQQTQDFIDSMIDRLPAFKIRLGLDPTKVTRAIIDLLADGTVGADPARSNGGTAGDRPLITVVLPVFNGAHFLLEAIDSVLGQNYPCLEIIVVDDGSTDDIEGAIAKLPVDVRFFRQLNSGPAGARNRGIRDASGSLVAFLDVDDLWPLNTLHQLADRLSDNRELQVVIGHAQMMTLDALTGQYRNSGTPETSFPYYIGSALYRRDVFEKIGLFDATLRYGEDIDWFRRLFESDFKSARVEAVTLEVRRHGGNMTAKLSPNELQKTVLWAAKRAIERTRQAERVKP